MCIIIYFASRLFIVQIDFILCLTISPILSSFLPPSSKVYIFISVWICVCVWNIHVINSWPVYIPIWEKAWAKQLYTKLGQQGRLSLHVFVGISIRIWGKVYRKYTLDDWLTAIISNHTVQSVHMETYNPHRTNTSYVSRITHSSVYYTLYSNCVYILLVYMSHNMVVLCI